MADLAAGHIRRKRDRTNSIPGESQQDRTRRLNNESKKRNRDKRRLENRIVANQAEATLLRGMTISQSRTNLGVRHAGVYQDDEVAPTGANGVPGSLQDLAEQGGADLESAMPGNDDDEDDEAYQAPLEYQPDAFPSARPQVS